MELIPSFAVDHRKIKPGIYVSRVDHLADQIVTTFDIRMTTPNTEPAIDPAAMHSIEHLVATFLRNHRIWKNKLIYWGPMGCMTGSYMIVKGNLSPKIIRSIMIEAMEFILSYDGQVPGTDITQCGNHLMHNLPIAKYYAEKFHRDLTLHFNYKYPTTKRQVTKEGDQFYDS